MDFNLPFGPWTQLVRANWGGFPAGLYVNPDRVMLQLVFDKQGDSPSGMLVSLRKAFAVDGDLCKAVQSQPREVTLLLKHSPSGSRRFAIVSATPAFVKYSHDELEEAVGKQFSELSVLSSFMQDMGKAYKVEVKDLAAVAEGEAQALLGDPASFVALFNPSGAKPQSPAAAAQDVARVAVGVDSSNKVVSLSLDAACRSLVVGGEEEARLQASQVLLEGALLNGVPCVVFDLRGAFSGLAKPNSSTKDFARHRMVATPLGFPFREYKLGSGIYVDLAFVTPRLFNEAFGLQGTDVGRAVELAWSQNAELHSLSDLSAAVERLAETPEVTRYVVLKARRLLKVVEKRHPAVFNKNVASELMMPWHEGIGKVFHVDLAGRGDAVNHLLVYSVLNAIPAPKNKKLRMVVCFDSPAGGVFPDVLRAVAEAAEGGIGCVLQAESELDAQPFDSAGARIELVGGGEAVATVGVEKPVRFTLRPSFTLPFAETPPGKPREAK